ncbi:MAG TPA: DUF1579 domain-containing protein [Pirellulaceae bacterium]|nr:DUF1579 domain-containing protein [Pirellulaceae bacterium]
MKFQMLGCAVVVAWLFSAASWAQDGSDAMERFKGHVGTWNAEIRMYGDPSGDPQVSKGTETNVMLGSMWLISHFKGDMMGMEFEGSSQLGYNPDTKKYVGTWVDSMSPYAMSTEGTWDERTKTLTQIGTGKDETGSEMRMKMTTAENSDGSRLFTMYMPGPDGEEFRVMEIHYTKAK